MRRDWRIIGNLYGIQQRAAGLFHHAAVFQNQNAGAMTKKLAGNSQAGGGLRQ